METQHTTIAVPGRSAADGQAPGSAVHKRTWFYYALARLAVTRNLAVAVAIAAMCVGAVGVTLWAVAAKQRADTAAAPVLPTLQVLQPLQLAPNPAVQHYTMGSNGALYQSGPDGSAMYRIDINTHPELYIPVIYTYKCGHEGRFTPVDNQFSAIDPAGCKAKLEQRLCPSCQAQADYRAKQAKKKHAAGNGQAHAAH